MAIFDQVAVYSPHLRHRLVWIVCCLAEWSGLERGGYGKRRETQVVSSFQFSVRTYIVLVREDVLFLVHVVALLPGGAALLRGVVVLPEAVFAVPQY